MAAILKLYFEWKSQRTQNLKGSIRVNCRPNFVCALILWRSGLGLLMGKFFQFLTELSAHRTSVFLFPDDNLSKCQWIFTKLGVCIDIVEISFWIANGQI